MSSLSSVFFFPLRQKANPALLGDRPQLLAISQQAATGNPLGSARDELILPLGLSYGGGGPWLL